ncbi:MAG: hypothetical protein KBB11_03665 [Bacteroidales bacterium]|jgi:exopolyphosphatase/guanosine-5'-triphosphate,3'-diphosphate pyrophosphatase|nr:hypothetical protein [Bacteroidales bacterium]HOY37903.1 hypothetical protein [Bacteroidales bacterium]HQP03860.1 hypothetical protein [Bacteroidales bacterium]
MIFATIDIGSNAGRLLIAHVYEKFRVLFSSKIALVRVPLRLGMDVFEKGYISEDKIQDLIKALQAYKLIMEIYKPVAFDACTTSAMREAANREDVLQRVIDATGINLRVIDGIEEAQLISEANNIYINRIYKDTLYIDVGGGSTECSLFSGERFITSKSFNIGTIRLMFDKVKSSEWDDLKQWLESMPVRESQLNCICTGGNISAITKLFGNTDHTIDYPQLIHACEELEKYSYEERMVKYSFRPDRADVIVPASKIFNNIMKWGCINRLIAPQLGLADGLAIELYKNHLKSGL